MNKIILFVFIFVLAISVIGCSGVVPTMEKNVDTSASVNNIPTTPSQQIGPDEKIIGLGKPITIKNIKFTVNSVTGYKQIGTSMFGKKTNGEFYKVCLSLENLGKTSLYLYDSAMIEPQFVLSDSQDRQFDSNFESEMYIDDKLDMMEQLQPGLPVDGCKIFELPTNVKGLKLLISKGWLTNEAISVTINDNEVKHEEAETSQQDKIDAQMAEARTASEERVEELMNKYNY
ncbi:MAG: DUF4352 domain-containing protein [Candidatus Woesearchaeota archaeon]